MTIQQEESLIEAPVRLIFDRGTILLDTEKKLPALMAISGVLWDARVGAFRAPASLYKEIVKSLKANNFEIQDRVLYSWGEAVNLSVPELRPYQEAALNAWRDAKGRGLIVLPTGSGKTVIGIAAIARTKKPAIVLVPTRILLEQWRERLREQFKMPIGIIGDGKSELAPVMVTTFESAYRYMNWIGNRFQLLIVDEAHHFGAGVRDEALEMCIAPYRLGLTATPVNNLEAKKRLGELVGENVYEVTVNELTGRYLAPFEHITIQNHSAVFRRKRSSLAEISVGRISWICRKA